MRACLLVYVVFALNLKTAFDNVWSKRKNLFFAPMEWGKWTQFWYMSQECFIPMKRTEILDIVWLVLHFGHLAFLPHAIAIIVLVSSKTYGLTISKPASIYVRNWLKINLSIIRVSTIAFHATCLNLSTTKTQPTTLISIEIANQNSCQTATTLEEFMYFELDMNYKRHTKIAKITVAQQNTANTAW